MRGQKVADLQDALKMLLQRGVILANDEATRGELSAALERERTEQRYGSATRDLVRFFQRERQLRPSGAVDGPTADALNALLEEWGLLDGTDGERSWVVRGRIVSHELRGLSELRVVAVDKNVGSEVRLGEGAGVAAPPRRPAQESVQQDGPRHLTAYTSRVVQERGARIPGGTAEEEERVMPRTTVPLGLQPRRQAVAANEARPFLAHEEEGTSWHG